MNENNLRKQIQKAFDKQEISAFVNVNPFSEMIKDNPDKAIDLIFQVYNNALDEVYTTEGKNMRAFVESHAGGPHEAIPSAIYNSVGTVYPYLERTQKNKALKQVLNILDGQNYQYVQISHTPYIREPLLLSDICVCRCLYWPGLDDGIRKIRAYNNFKEFKEDNMNNGLFKREKVRSDFILATTVMHKMYSSWGEEFVKEIEPNFLSRVYKGIVAIDFARLPDERLERTLKEFYSAWPNDFCEKLDSIRNEKDWVDYKLFE